VLRFDCKALAALNKGAAEVKKSPLKRFFLIKLRLDDFDIRKLFTKVSGFYINIK
jgi:hypothetical protein